MCPLDIMGTLLNDRVNAKPSIDKCPGGGIGRHATLRW